MSAAALATRMGLKDASSVRSLETKEVAGGIRLSSLRRAAEAMDCALVYAFIPNESLQGSVRRQAMKVLEAQLRRASQTMALEAQEAQTLDASREAQLQTISESGWLWSQRGDEE